MGWATHHITKLQAGETVSFRPKGGSMSGKIENGQLCTVVPMTDPSQLQVGAIVLCRVRGAEYLHLVKAIQAGRAWTPGTFKVQPQPVHVPPRFLIGNNRGGINGWVSADSIYGVCTKVEP